MGQLAQIKNWVDISGTFCGAYIFGIWLYQKYKKNVDNVSFNGTNCD